MKNIIKQIQLRLELRKRRKFKKDFEAFQSRSGKYVVSVITVGDLSYYDTCERIKEIEKILKSGSFDLFGLIPSGQAIEQPHQLKKSKGE